MRVTIGRNKVITKAGRLEKRFIGVLTAQLRAKKILYQVEDPNVVSFMFRTDVMGKCGKASCRVGMFAKTIVFMVKIGIPSPNPECMKCVSDYAMLVNNLYSRDSNQFIGRVWFHNAKMVYQLIHLCRKNDSIDQVFMRDMINTTVKEVRWFHEALEESGLLEHFGEAHSSITGLETNGDNRNQCRRQCIVNGAENEQK